MSDDEAASVLAAAAAAAKQTEEQREGEKREKKKEKIENEASTATVNEGMQAAKLETSREGGGRGAWGARMRWQEWF